MLMKVSSKQNCCAIFLAGGSGKRMTKAVKDKILVTLCGTPVIAHSVRAFAKSKVAKTAVFVCRDDVQKKLIQGILKKECSNFEGIFFCKGGKERGDSVLNGLKCAFENGVNSKNFAFIHDCARPLLQPDSLKKLSKVAQKEGAAVLAKRCVNTVKRVPLAATPDKACTSEDLDRSRLWETETPQVFPLGKILSAYETVAKKKLHFTDDVSVFCTIGGKVAFVENPYPNPKITTPEDLLLLEAILKRA